MIRDRYKCGIEDIVLMDLKEATHLNDAFFLVAERLKDSNPDLSKSILSLVKGFNNCFREIVDSIESGESESLKLSDYMVYSDLVVFSRLTLAVELIEEDFEYILLNKKSIKRVNDVIAHCLLRELYLNRL